MTTQISCPKCGGLSDDPEFCSECGGALTAGAMTPQAAATLETPDTSKICPECGTPRLDGGRFCDTCRYDYQTRQSFAPTAAPPAEPAIAQPAASPAPSPSTIAPPASKPAPTPDLRRWEWVANVDVSLKKPEYPEPQDIRERIYPVDFDECLIGRTSQSQGIHPEIALIDPGVSRRHARLTRQPGGTLVLLDLGTENGTVLNGAPLPPNVPTELKEGDEIVLGCWTRMVLRAI